MALLVVEQDVSGIMQIADIAHLMVEGSIVMSGRGIDLFADEEMAARYLGADEFMVESREAAALGDHGAQPASHTSADK